MLNQDSNQNISNDNIQVNTRSSIISDYETQNNFSFDYYGLTHNEACLFVLDQTRDISYPSLTDRLQHYKSLLESEYGYSTSINNHIDSNGELIEKMFENSIGLTEYEKSILINLRIQAENHDWSAENTIALWKDYANSVAENAILENLPNLNKLLAVISIAKHSGELWTNESELDGGDETVEASIFCQWEAAIQDATYMATDCSDLDFPCLFGTVTHSLATYHNCKSDSN